MLSLIRFQNMDWTMFCQTGAFRGVKSQHKQLLFSPYSLFSMEQVGWVTLPWQSLLSLSVYLYAYICIRVCAHMYMYTCTHMCTCIYTCILKRTWDYPITAFAQPSTPMFLRANTQSNIWHSWCTGHNITAPSIILWFLTVRRNSLQCLFLKRAEYH